MTACPPAAAWRCIFPMTRNAVLPVLFMIGCMLCSSAIATADESNAGSFEMQMVYKYSQEFRELTKGRPEWEHLASEEWPPLGSPEFYHTLVMQDRHKRASRNLLANETEGYSLAPTNATQLISTLGAIHYSLIALGTPPKLFFVALDTGSDLLWVPCDCQECSVANWTSYGIATKLEFAIYSPTNSTSSKSVACNSDICKTTLSPTSCDAGATKPCTYISKYSSPNTSSSGTIVQDVVLLNPESGIGARVSADIYFGCGTLQTGNLLDGSAPNGLFGLGPEVYSVPRTLAKNGVTRDVFSMCFSTPTSLGRLVFGKKPIASLQSTPLISISPSIYYVLGVEGVVAGGVKLNVSAKVVFDTGTSLTTLPSDIIKLFGDTLASKTTLETWSYNFSASLHLSHCWNATTNAELLSLSSLSFIFGGGGVWAIADPLLGFGTNGKLEFVCLGIIATEKLDDPSIIGYNFMGMYEYYFDLENSTFSWGPSDCSGSNATSTIAEPPITAPSISPSSAPSSKSPSTSPSTTEGTSPSAPLNDLPQVPTPPSSNAHTSASQNIYFQVLGLVVFTIFFYSANQIS